MRNFCSGSRSSGRLAAAVIAAAVVLLPGLAQAQQATVVQRSFINLSFEEPNLQTAGCRVYIGEQYVPGWTTTHNPFGQQNVGGCVAPSGFVPGELARIIELWRTPRTNAGLTVNARSGSQLAELNAEQLSRISQNVCLVQGDEIQWRFSHRGRASATTQDRMRFLLGPSPIVEVGTTNSGAGGVITTFQGSATSAAGPNGWRDYQGTFAYAGIGGTTDIGFEALSGTATTGNFLDDIQVVLKPFVELAGGTYETTEGVTSGLPALRVAGQLDSDLVVQITTSSGAGNPVLGVDYTTPTGTSTFTVRIPARSEPYHGELISLGLTAPANTVFDGSRVVGLQLVPDDSRYFTRSSTQCGAAGVATSAWTILDDDVDLSISKSVSPANARSGDNVTYTLTTTSNANARINVTGAVIRDPAVTGLDCSAATPTCTATRPALCAPDHSLATLQGSGMVLPEFLPGEQVQLRLACRVTASGVAP
ncbi:DUF11 domain-containing protein [Luteimonas terrae]|uniref:DUF11 domain-containing protein n=1 Tax=Luteimonas terrae TaxID=1530191 RepID=A0A4R5U7W9_9GAMM|nr:DUF11 domain-containing protein [Luteimonas terrae]TDK30097.1 DUF11 domain-containing protein [Luteimonas terrae]